MPATALLTSEQYLALPDDTAKHLKRKVEPYLANGSKTVWVVFPDSKSVTLHSVGAAHDLKADQVLEDSLLPGFSTPVAAFFELT